MDNAVSSKLFEELQALSHEDKLEITASTLRTLITTDPLLNDLPPDVTLEELSAQIAVEQGQNITVEITRFNEPSLFVVIPQQKCTVRDLKKAIQRCFELKQKRSRNRTKISWRYIWRTYNLKNTDYAPFGSPDRDSDNDEKDAKKSSKSKDLGPILLDDNNQVSCYGVRNKSKLSFVKRSRKTERYLRYRERREQFDRELSEERRQSHRKSRDGDRERRSDRERRRERSRERLKSNGKLAETLRDKERIAGDQEHQQHQQLSSNNSERISTGIDNKEPEKAYSRVDPRNRKDKN